jgi:hypothetical protein
MGFSWDDADRFEKRFGFAGARLQNKLDKYHSAFTFRNRKS